MLDSAIAAPPASGETFQAAPPPPATEQEEIQAPPDEEPVVAPVQERPRAAKPDAITNAECHSDAAAGEVLHSNSEAQD